MPFLGIIAGMEIGITEGVPGPVKKEIMKSLCRNYGVDIDQGDQDMTVHPGMESSFASRRQRERS